AQGRSGDAGSAHMQRDGNDASPAHNATLRVSSCNPGTVAPMISQSGAERPTTPARRPRGRRRILTALAVLLLLLAAPAYSYTTRLRGPSSRRPGPATSEWIRANHGNWLVDEVEHYYYSWKAPGKGGPQLTSLPSVGVGPAAVTSHRHVAAGTP